MECTPEQPHEHRLSQSLVRMGTAARIRELRIRAGKSQTEMTRLLGLNPAWYADLERHDPELVSTLTLFQAMHLASIVGVPLHDLLGEIPVPEQRIALMDLPDLIISHTRRKGISVEQFEDSMGWELREFLKAPVQIAADLPILFLQAVSAALGINWLSLVPDETET